MESFFWLVALLIFVVLELISMGLTTIWFAGGALVAYILNVAGANEVIQIIAFLVVSFVLLFFTRPLARKMMEKNTVKTNADAVVGKFARVTQTIDNIKGTGRAIVDGEEWMARSENDTVTFEVDELVTVLSVEGVKIIVKVKEDN